MENIVVSFFTLVLILISLFLIFIILLQRANTNAGLGTAFGGGLAESTFGADTGNILTKGTVVACVAFFMISFGLYLGYIARAGDKSKEGIILPEVSLEEVSSDSTPTATEAEDSVMAPEQAPSLDELLENAHSAKTSVPKASTQPVEKKVTASDTEFMVAPTEEATNSFNAETPKDK